MIPTRFLRTGLILLVIFVGRLTTADEVSRVSNSICQMKSIKSLIFGVDDLVCPLIGIDYSLGVIEVCM